MSVRGFKPTEKGTSIVCTPHGGEQEMLTVTEPGLYRLIFKSRKPEADRFRTFVTHDVLPSIRQYGCWPAPELSHGPMALIRIDEEALGRAIGNHMGLVRSELHELKSETSKRFDSVNDRFDSIDVELKRIAHRQQLRPETKRKHCQVVFRMFGRKCPCCGRRDIVNSHGDKLSCLQFDHWKLPSINTVDWTWPVCDDCNLKLRDGDFHSQCEGRFRHYQETRKRVEDMMWPRLPGFDEQENQ